MQKPRWMPLLVALALAVVAGASCSEPTKPRIPPTGEDPKQEPPDRQGFDTSAPVASFADFA